MKGVRYLVLIIVNCFVMVVYCHGKAFISERVLLAPLSQWVALGDTVRISGQVLSTDYNDFYPYSRYVYVELIGKNDSVVARNKVRMADDGVFFTNIPLTDSSPSGVYFLRGYTQFMRNRGNSALPLLPFYVGVEQKNNLDMIRMGAMFFPEGGHLTYDGGVQNVGVYLYEDNNGDKLPTSVNFAVLKNARDTVCYGRTNEHGLAMVSFIPENGSLYMLSANSIIFNMPHPQDTPTLRTVVNRNLLVCNVIVGKNAVELADSLCVYMYHSSFGIRRLALQNGVGVADVSDCAPGLLTLWLTDSSGNVLAQRVLWTGDYDNGVEALGIDVCTGGMPDDTVHVSLDPNFGHSSVFVRFVPESCSNVASAFEVLNLSNEVFSLVPLPTALDAETHKQVRRNFDTWLLSATQTMIDSDFLRGDSVNYIFPIETVLSVSGSVADGKKPLRGANVHIYNVQNNDVVSTYTDDKGCFNAIVNDFVDGCKLYMQAYNSKGKAGTYTYLLDKPDFPPVVKTCASGYMPDILSVSRLRKIALSVDTVRRHKVEEVVVKRNRPVEKGYNWVRTKNQFNYYDHDFLARHPNIMTVKDAVLYTGRVKVSNGDNCISWISQKLQGLSYPEIVIDDNPSVYSQIVLVVNGMKIEREVSDFLSMSIGNVESIELVQPLDVRSFWYSAGYGFFDIKLRTTVKPESKVSNGVTIQPLGIAKPLHPFVLRLPSKEGNYKMVVDVVSADRRIRSLVRKIEVKGKK